MRAVVFDRYGPPDVLSVRQLPCSEPGPGQVRVRAIAGGVQPFDAQVRRGEMPIPVTFPQQLGNEFAGVVDAVGTRVEGWAEGQSVVGWAPLASLAEYVLTDARSIVSKPPEMPWEVAGGLGASGQTALTALRDLDVGPRDVLLIHAAAGGAGSMATQLARFRGASVIGTASERNHAYVARLGAVPVSYGAGLVDRVRAAAPGKVTAVLDAVGGQALVDSLEIVADKNRIATLVDHTVAERMGLRGVRAQRSTAQLSELVDLCRVGALRVPLRGVYPLDAIVEAHRQIETGHGAGKIVIRVDR